MKIPEHSALLLVDVQDSNIIMITFEKQWSFLDRKKTSRSFILSSYIGMIYPISEGNWMVRNMYTVWRRILSFGKVQLRLKVNILYRNDVIARFLQRIWNCCFEGKILSTYLFAEA